MNKPFFTIEMLPANEGDAIWIEYGKTERIRRILIDGGPISAYKELEEKVKTLPAGDKRVEVIVITHVDTDHIEGIIRMFAEKRHKWLISPEDIWFNGYRHMKDPGVLGGREGDFLSALIHKRAYKYWNKKFGHKAITVLPDGSLPGFLKRDEIYYPIPDI
ncbi:MAG: MBL fold metallo-hydrolase [Bacteroidales bacterium]